MDRQLNAGGDMSGHAAGGNDIYAMHGSTESDNFIYGDAGGNMSDFAKGGNDTYNQFDETFFPNIFYGDAGGNMSGFAQGGNDTFNKTGGEGSTFYGVPRQHS
jgi:hypothetical protein